MDTFIQKYNAIGKLYLWKFKGNVRNYPGWNLTADATSCDSLLNLFELMKFSRYPSRKTVNTENVTKNQVKVCGDYSYISAQKLTLNYRKGSEGLWYIHLDSNNLEISMGDEKLNELESAIKRVKVNEGDFAISDNNEENILYFWWLLK
jgi:site-specific DNA-adenine methylase